MSKERIVSVDFLRGFAVAAMILVNNPGSWEFIYPPFKHSSWHGCSPTDLVFPFFLFIVGISIVYSLDSVRLSGNHNAALVKIAKRAALLFAFGLFLNLFPFFDFANVRIPGVLQRIALVFFFSALLFLKSSTKTIGIVAFVTLLAYWFSMTMIPVPGIGKASLEPTANLGAWLDYKLLKGHLWSHSNFWDPEGLFSTIPSIVSGLFGILTGYVLKSEKPASDKLINLFVAGNSLLIIALAWDLVFPINKNLWTSSFVLYTSGIAMNALAIAYWWIDVKGHKNNTGFFMAFGSNAISAYLLSELLGKLMYTIFVSYQGELQSLKEIYVDFLSINGLDPRAISLYTAILWVILLWIPIQLLYTRKIFIKV